MATKVWRGGAANVAQVSTLTIANANTGKVLTVTIGEVSITATCNGTNGTVQARLLNRAWAASTAGQFREITATNATNSLTLTGKTAGKPFTLSTTANSGMTLTYATTTAATGAKVFNAAQNWSGGVAPASSDTLVFENSDRDCLYNLNQPTLDTITVKVAKSYTGKLGLPRVNEDNTSRPYVEYRSRYLVTNLATATIGDGEGSGSGRIMLDANNTNCTLLTYGTGSPAETGVEALLVNNARNGSVFTIADGSVGVSVFTSEVCGLRTLNVGGGTVRTGSGVTVNTVHTAGGTVTLGKGPTTLTQDDGEVTVTDGAITTIKLNKGTLKYRGNDTVALVEMYGGTLDFRTDMQSRTITNMRDYSKTHYIYDPAATVTWTNGIYYTQPLADSLNLGTKRKIAPAAW
jgi:hypothetical protein